MEYAVLADLTADDRRRVLAATRRRRYRSGEMLFHEGDPGESFHLIAKGAVLIQLGTPQGDIVSLTVLVAGDGFGEQSWFAPDALRTASARAIQPVETMTISRAAFVDLASRHPEVVWVLLQQLAAQVRRLSQQVLDFLFVPAERRVLRQVLDLDRVFRGPVPLTQDDLASMAGTTRSTANRALRSAQTNGYLELRRGGFTVTDRAALERQAQSG